MPGRDAQFLKGILSMLLLRLLADSENYGYAVVEQLQAAGVDLKEGTVYPALSRLEAKGWLASRLVPSASGPARKYYTATDTGRAELVSQEAAWTLLVGSVDQLMNAPAATEAPTQDLGANR